MINTTIGHPLELKLETQQSKLANVSQLIKKHTVVVSSLPGQSDRTQNVFMCIYTFNDF